MHPATLASCAILLRCLALGEASAIGPLCVTRTSLYGFCVSGGNISLIGLDEAEAATLLARAAALSAAQQKVSAPAHPDLLKAPAIDGLDHLVHETWRAGKASQRRIDACRRRSIYVTQRLTRGQIEITYPSAATMPAIEAAS